MRRAFFLIVGVATAVLWACGLIVGIDDRKVWTDGGIGAEGGPADPCARVGYPDRPDLKTSGAADAVTLTAVLHKLNLGVDGTNFGFNLDKTCTCPGPETCTRPPTAMKMACDKDGSIPSGVGADNAGVDIFRSFPDAGMLEKAFNDSLAMGIAGIMVQIQNYNGLKDDAQVRVSIYPLLKLAPDGGAPKWDGSDSWVLDSNTIQNGVSIYTVSDAWVANGVLVASMNIPVVIGSSAVSAVRVDLKNGYLVANLELNGSGAGATLKRMSGELGGRWNASDFLTTLGNVPDPTNPNVNLCKTDITYEFIKRVICDARDITSSGTDNQGQPCDAVSLALGFEATPAAAGPMEPAPKPGPVCGMAIGYSDTCSN